MTIFSDAVSVSTTVGTVFTVAAADYAQTVYVTNYGATSLWLGHGTVAAQSFPLNNGTVLSLNMMGGETLYGFASSGTCEIRLLAVTGSR